MWIHNEFTASVFYIRACRTFDLPPRPIRAADVRTTADGLPWRRRRGFGASSFEAFAFSYYVIVSSNSSCWQTALDEVDRTHKLYCGRSSEVDLWPAKQLRTFVVQQAASSTLTTTVYIWDLLPQDRTRPRSSANEYRPSRTTISSSLKPAALLIARYM
jgi:hypothetical protein